MGDFARVLIHPSRWSEAAALAPEERALLAGALLLFTAVVASAVGFASSRWARRRAARVGGVADQVTARVRRGVVALLVLIGLYWEFLVAPLPGRLGALGSGAAWVLGALVAARLSVHLVSLFLSTSVAHVSAVDRVRLEREYVPLGEKVATLAVSLILIILVAKHFGQDVTSLVAALGVGSLAIGLAAQQTLGNMIAGFVLLVDRPFRPGDRIKLASGEAGEVMEIGVRSTRIALHDGNLLIVPNAELANSRVVNQAFPRKPARAEVRLVLAHAADVEKAIALLVTIASEDSRVATDPPPAARLAALTPLGAELVLSALAAPEVEPGSVEERVRRHALKRFSEEKIELARASG